MARFIYHASVLWSWTEVSKCLPSTTIPSHAKRARWSEGTAYCESALGQGLMEEGAAYDRKHEIVF